MFCFGLNVVQFWQVVECQETMYSVNVIIITNSRFLDLEFNIAICVQ